MPSALALAQEVESFHEGYTFVTCFARSQEDRERKQFPKVQERQQASTNSQVGAGQNPHFTKPYKVQVSLSKMLQPSRSPAYRNAKPAASGRSDPHKRQRVNHNSQGADSSDNAVAAVQRKK